MTDAWARLHGYSERREHLMVGLMTGTSADAVDAALVRFEGAGSAARPVLDCFRQLPLEAGLRDEVLEICAAQNWVAERLMRLDAALGELYAVAVLELLGGAGRTPAEVDAIASHGQTVRHVPRSADDGRALTLQIGSAAILAERTGIAVVSDFRSRDVAAGGEGAPLVPVADALLVGSDEESRVLLNLGGMANLTYLPRAPRGAPASDARPGHAETDVLAFDTGPGNAVMDALADLRSGGRERFDASGALAAAGRVDGALLAELLADDFFAQPPPRSTGRERFGLPFARELRERGLARKLSEADIARTALELTSASVADAVSRFVRPRGDLDAVYASGGGVSNPALMTSLALRLAPARVESLDALGVPPAAKEAMAFALLGHLTLCGHPGNSLVATGAARHVVLGHVTPGR
ncbi:MAG: anhydro-N-acetylmuramic acid kinase [Candidatus Eisenbacteria bacterium]